MVTSPHWLATSSGLSVLRDGGNAVEAALAAATVLAVVYPHMNGVGGDSFWLFYDANTGDVDALIAAGTAGRQCNFQTLRSAGVEDAIPRRGPLSVVTVPGAVDGWCEAYRYSKERLGGRKPFSSLFRDAIYYAEHGFPVSPSHAVWLRKAIGRASVVSGGLERFAGFRKTFLKPDGSPYGRGERFVQVELANTLSQIATGGREAFYEGWVAKEICRELERLGGLLEEEDFAHYRCEWTKPLTTRFRDWTVLNVPPPSQGILSLALLNILECFPVNDISDGSADYYHLMIEATKCVFADRDLVADPNFAEVPLNALLSKTRAAEYAKRIDIDTAATVSKSAMVEGDTVWLGVVDERGNAVSMIQSLYFDFGSGVVAGNTGVLLQNRGCSFVLSPGHPNGIAPGKRPFHTLNPAMVLHGDGALEMVYGTMGGDGQPQTQAALVTRILDMGMDIQTAIDAPRWLYGRTWGEQSTHVYLESRIPVHVVEELVRRGHDVVMVDPWDDRMGHAQAIWIDPRSGVRHGGADPRGDGMAAGF
nr:gamma-glutamyltransferase [Alicyclobacillus macrosporangiidus]